MKKYLPVLVIIGIVFVFFNPLFLYGQLPIPSDTIVGLYNPYRDYYLSTFPRGVPFKNFLITDPVRQQYPWRNLSITLEKQLQLPLWNPYAFAGTAHVANLQSGAFYPLNIIFFIFPFPLAWGLFIFLAPLLAGIFMYVYLRNLRITNSASFLGAICFSFCGFSVAWLEWGTLVHVALWLPLMFLCVDKLINQQKKISLWSILLCISLLCSFFAGHVQTFVYIFILLFCYIVVQIYNFKNKKTFTAIISAIVIFGIVSIIQWGPLLQFILQSGRSDDLANWHQPGWFIPWQNLAQFIAPDFFGNPATQNYFGVWNYGEFIGYFGIFPLLMVIYAFVFKRDKKTYFMEVIVIFALIFALPTPFAKIPYMLHIPFLMTSQPTRLLIIIDFGLAVLAAYGLDYFLTTKKNATGSIIILGVFFMILWCVVLQKEAFGIGIQNLLVAKHNLYFPTALFVICGGLLSGYFLINEKKIRYIIVSILLLITVIDLFRFAQKFDPFTSQAYLFPTTATISFLNNNLGNSRIMTTDSRIFPPNFPTQYHLQSIEGYDPLYIERYGELIIAAERNRPDISTPFGFNRIITPHNFDSAVFDLLGVKYILSLGPLNSPKLIKVFQEGQTSIYKNKNALPRAFFVKHIIVANSKQDAINKLFSINSQFQDSAIVETYNYQAEYAKNNAEITEYLANSVSIRTNGNGKGFLILTDTYYPTWHATIDNRSVPIYRTDFNFRGVVVPAGEHSIRFFDTLF